MSECIPVEDALAPFMDDPTMWPRLMEERERMRYWLADSYARLKKTDQLLSRVRRQFGLSNDLTEAQKTANRHALTGVVGP